MLTLASLEVVKSGGGAGATARLLSSLQVSGNVLVTSGQLDLANQPAVTVMGNWTVQAAGSVLPTVTPVTFSGAGASTITVNSGAGNFFDVFVTKTAAATLVTLTSTSNPVLPVVCEEIYVKKLAMKSL